MTKEKRLKYHVGYFSNNKKKDEGFFLDGKKEGEWRYYYKTGKIKTIFNYKNGMIHGKLVRYDIPGIKMTIGNYKNNKKHGTFSIIPFDGDTYVYTIYQDDEYVITAYGSVRHILNEDYYHPDPNDEIRDMIDLEYNLDEIYELQKLLKY